MGTFLDASYTCLPLCSPNANIHDWDMQDRSLARQQPFFARHTESYAAMQFEHEK